MSALLVSRRRLFCALALFPALSASVVARAQAKPARVGIIGVSEGGIYSYWKRTFAAEFRKLGLVDGENLRLVWYDVAATGADARAHTAEELRTLGRKRAAEMARDGLDCLVSNGEPHARFLQEATRSIPIVAVVPDPVALGFAQTLARPGGNVTGLHAGEEGVALKRVELLRRLDPKLTCVAWIGIENFRRSAASLEAALRAQGLRFAAFGVSSFEAEAAAKVGDAIARLRREGCGAVQLDPLGENLAVEVGKAALRHRMLVSGHPARSEGFLFSLEARRTDAEDSARRIPAIVARILRGEKPAEMPFEGPSRYRLALNLGTAAKLGLRVPPDIVLQADEVVGP